MKQKRIAECKYNSLAPYSGKEANGKIEYEDGFEEFQDDFIEDMLG